MIVTDLALRDMSDRSDATFQRICQWLVTPFQRALGLKTRTVTKTSQSLATTSVLSGTSLVKRPEPIDFTRHRSLVAARRALQLAQKHRFDEARSAFHTAMVADPSFDPGSLAGFWELPRRGMFSAIEACEDLGDYHAAAVLEVRILQASRPVKDSIHNSSSAIAYR